MPKVLKTTGIKKPAKIGAGLSCFYLIYFNKKLSAYKKYEEEV